MYIMWCGLVYIHEAASQYYVDAVYYYRSSVVCRSVTNCEPCQNGWTVRYAIWDMDSGGRSTQGTMY